MTTRAKAGRNGRMASASLETLEKCPTGIGGLDQISNGGLPRGRTSIACGGPGCGKTMLGLEFIVRGAMQYDEPGVVMAFEETPEELAKNVASLGFDLRQLSEDKKIFMDHIYLEPRDIEETGDFDLEGLFVRLASAVQEVGAKRVFLDTLEALFSGFRNEGILRAEIRRLFRWLKEQGLTAVVTAERGAETLTRHGLEEYVSDCVILLDHRIEEQISTRRLRIVKYRGTCHGADEYPFLIDERGISVLPLTTLHMNHQVSDERVSSGIADLDQMLEGKGYYRGSTVLVSGTAGSGKTILGATFAAESCRRGERCLYLGFEESTGQLLRNVRSAGIDLEPYVKQGLFSHHAWRATQYGMEMHLLRIHRLLEECNPASVILDPISCFFSSGSDTQVGAMLVRLIDFLKDRGITAILTSLNSGSESKEESGVGISSLIDTWIVLRDVEFNGERNRCVYVIKSRGIANSNQLREFLITSRGIRILPAYVGPAGVLTGSTRVAQEAREKAAALVRWQEIEARRRDLEQKRQKLEAQIAELRREYAAEETEVQELTEQAETRQEMLQSDIRDMAKSRQSAGLKAQGASGGGT